MEVAIIIFLELLRFEDCLLKSLASLWFADLGVDLQVLLLELLDVFSDGLLLAGVLLLWFLYFCFLFFVRAFHVLVDISLDCLSIGVAWYEVRHLHLGGHFAQLFPERVGSRLVGRDLDLEDGRPEARGGSNEP
jgi:hypothetical protein